MIRKFTFCLIYILTCTVVYSQNNFKEAYIITLENDTVYGYANFRSDYQNIRECQFKKELSDNSNILQPEDIIEYRFIENNRLYVSRRIELDQLETDVFLEYLVKGVASLYYYIDEDNTKYYFIENKKGKMTAITQQKEIIRNNSLVKDQSYKKSIFNALDNPPAMVDAINGSQFSEKSLSQIIIEYHNLTCAPEEKCIQFKSSRKTNTIFRFSVYGGVMLFKYKVSSGNKTLVKTTSILPQLGGQIIISSPRLSESLSLVLDGSVYKLPKTKLINETSAAGVRSDIWDPAEIAANIKINAQYKYPKGRIKPMVGVGFGLDFTPNVFTVFSGNVGVEISLKNQHSCFVSASYESHKSQAFGYNCEFTTTHLKLGYIF